MPIENILKKIEEEASITADGIIAKAKEEGDRLREEYSDKASKLTEQFKSKAVKRAADEKHRLLVSEELELRKATLRRKHEILDELYKEAKQQISAISGEEYLDLIGSMIIAGAVTGKEEIVPTGQAKLFSGRFIDKLNKSFASGGNFSVAGKEGDFTWGVVLREGKRVVNLSLETIFDLVIGEIEPEVSKILFKGD